MRLEDMNHKYIENKFDIKPPIPKGCSPYDECEDMEDMYPLITFKFIAIILMSFLIAGYGFYRLYKEVSEGGW